MLIHNKFIYLSLPRCASTAFHISCIKQNLNIKHYNSMLDSRISNQEFINNMDLLKSIQHVHEDLNTLIKKFGNQYEIISVKRNKYERFLSYWNHCLGELYRNNEIELYNICKKLSIDDILFYNSTDVISSNSIKLTVLEFFKRIKYKSTNTKINNLFNVLFIPLSRYHLNNENIIWFEFNKLYKLENWVSNKLNIDFKLEQFGNSMSYKSDIQVDNNFIEKYDNIYNYYEYPKKIKTLL